MMIVADSLSKSYKNIVALNNLNLSVQAGEICGILGPNGSGKSTLFKILCKLITPDSGTFKIASNKKKPVGAIIEKPALFEYLSAEENLKILSRIQKIPNGRDAIKQALLEVGLSPDRKDRVGNYSMGMKQRLSIAMALLNHPDCLILDEPFVGLDPLGMQSLRQLIKKLAHQENLTVLISSHLLDEISRSCDTLHVLRQGTIVQSGSTESVLSLNAQSYKICAENLSKSMILADRKAEIIGGSTTLPLTIGEAPELLKALMLEGINVTYFGSEANLNTLYQAK